MAIVTAKQAAPIDMMSGKSTMSADPAGDSEAAGSDQDSQGFSIEIEVDGQGNISVCLESGAQEAAEHDGGAPESEDKTPAKSIDDALKIAKEMYTAEIGEAVNPQAMWNEEAATRGPATATA